MSRFESGWTERDKRDPATKIREAAREASQAESFMLSVARESIAPEGGICSPTELKGTAYVPARFAVFLSGVADRAWTGQKRIFLQETLTDIIFQEAEVMRCETKAHAQCHFGGAEVMALWGTKSYMFDL